jgi:hypothetical protein
MRHIGGIGFFEMILARARFHSSEVQQTFH